MTAKVTIVVCDPTDKAARVRASAEVEALCAAHPEARTTWLQSSATKNLTPHSTMAEHVLTCIIETGNPVALHNAGLITENQAIEELKQQKKRRSK